MSQVDFNKYFSKQNEIEELLKVNSGVDSKHVEFAKIQLALAVASKQAATNLMKDIEANQALQKECQDILQKARYWQTYATEHDGKTHPFDKMADSDKKSLESVIDYCKNKNIEITQKDGKENTYTTNELNLLIEGLSAHLEQLGSKTQTQMVQVNDYMAQYNSYLQGASSALTDANSNMNRIFGS